jgi:hypothetical protein
MTVRWVMLKEESPSIGFREKTVFGFQGFGSIYFCESGVIVYNPWSSSPLDGRDHVEHIEITRQSNKATLRLNMRDGWSRSKNIKRSFLASLLGKISARAFPPVVFGTNELIDGEILNPEAIDSFVIKLTNLGFNVIVKTECLDADPE